MNPDFDKKLMRVPVPSGVSPTRTAPLWPRRDFLTRAAVAAATPAAISSMRRSVVGAERARTPEAGAARGTSAPWTAEQQDSWETLAQQAVDAAMSAGAKYADARITRSVLQPMRLADVYDWRETLGVGVRALVNDHWGFAAMPSGDRGAVERLARAAVGQARLYGRGLPRTVELGAVPPAVGRWATPVGIDPFTVPFEEKVAVMQYWLDYAHQLGSYIDTRTSELHFSRQERVVVNSDGARFTQTVYEGGGTVTAGAPALDPVPLEKLTSVGKGWELVTDADIPEQLRALPARLEAYRVATKHPKPAQVGRYTVVCDGATMAALLDLTLGIATQLDRALGYEANTSGTSFLDDPLAMLGTFQVASPLVTVNANRSAPTQLATVKWDDEGVEPEEFSLVEDGILVDYQTTREQAAWLAPYYRKSGKPVRSHGCAAAESAIADLLQQPPNIALAPNAADVSLGELIAAVKDGVFLMNAMPRVDFQTRTGMLTGVMREIKNGKLGAPLAGGAVRFDTIDLWKNVIALGGPSTRVLTASSSYPYSAAFDRFTGRYPVKGSPPQRTSSSVQGVAATIANQPVVNPRRRA
jgi:TldD protein